MPASSEEKLIVSIQKLEENMVQLKDWVINLPQFIILNQSFKNLDLK